MIFGTKVEIINVYKFGKSENLLQDSLFFFLMIFIKSVDRIKRVSTRNGRFVREYFDNSLEIDVLLAIIEIIHNAWAMI